jgi:hypothetical protein
MLISPEIRVQKKEKRFAATRIQLHKVLKKIEYSCILLMVYIKRPSAAVDVTTDT